MKTYLRLYAFCIPVYGKSTCVLYNLQEETLTEIPEMVYEFLITMQNKSWQDLEQEYVNQIDILSEYKDFILAQGWGFLTTEPEKFPAINFNYRSPHVIQQATIKVDFEHYDALLVCSVLGKLGCRHLNCVIEKPNKYALLTFLEGLQDSLYRSIHLFVKHTIEMEEFCLCYKQQFPRLLFIVLYDAPCAKKIQQDSIVLLQESYQNIPTLSGANQLFASLSFFVESQQYNPYYNQKVFIDTFGNIKNVAHQQQFYGNVNENNWHLIFYSQIFQKLWHVHYDPRDA